MASNTVHLSTHVSGRKYTSVGRQYNGAVLSTSICFQARACCQAQPSCPVRTRSSRSRPARTAACCHVFAGGGPVLLRLDGSTSWRRQKRLLFSFLELLNVFDCGHLKIVTSKREACLLPVCVMSGGFQQQIRISASSKRLHAPIYNRSTH